MPSLILIVGLLGAAYFSTFIYALLRNLILARKTGFPSIIIPWDQNHIVWMMTSVPLRPTLKTWLPTRIYSRLTMSIYGWEFHERLRPFQQYFGGKKSYMHVGCGRLEFWTADAEIAADILRRPGDFQQVELVNLLLARFGHNVLTSNGEKWAKQRKIVAGVINERVSKAVFAESIEQTEGLVREVCGPSGEGPGTAKLFEMMKKITMNVLSGATMGKSVPFNDTEPEKPQEGFKLTYVEAVKILVKAVPGPMILPRWFLFGYPSFMPGYEFIRSLGHAVDEFPVHTRAILQEERQRSQTTKENSSSRSVISQLLQASADSEKGEGLTEEEIVGNIFIFTSAGFDTTANTLSYALVLLARYPRWQRWLEEEVDRLIPASMSNEEVDYAAVFPQATRMLAFMFEVLRLYTPLIHITKQNKTPQTIKTSQGEKWLPANVTVYINCVALHLNPDVYRNINLPAGVKESETDELEFRPTRWLNSHGSQQTFFQPPKGSFLPWSAGPRICPGQKMAQVEFSAVLMTLLRRHRLEAVALEGENEDGLYGRLDKRMKDSVSILTLQMSDIYDLKDDKDGIPLRLVRR